MISFQIGSIPVRIHWFFFLLVAFLGGVMGVKQPMDWVPVLVFMAAATFSILIHELGHAYAGLNSGAPRCEIELGGMGGLAIFPGAHFNRGQSIWVSAAGPFASIALAVIAFASSRVLFPFLSDGGLPQFILLIFISNLILVNVVWTIFNLCPVLPLDGGQILNSLLGPSNLKITCIIGFVFLAMMAIVLWWLTRSIFNMIIIGFLAKYSWDLYRQIP